MRSCLSRRLRVETNPKQKGQYVTAATEISMWTTIVTGLLAIATGAMAFYTRGLASKTAAGVEQTDRHHRENLRPYCVIKFDRASQNLPFGPEFAPRWGGELAIARIKNGRPGKPPSTT